MRALDTLRAGAMADAWESSLGNTRVAVAGAAICVKALSARWRFGQGRILTAFWCRALCRQLSRELSRKMTQVGEDVPEWLKRELPPPPRLRTAADAKAAREEREPVVHHQGVRGQGPVARMPAGVLQRAPQLAAAHCRGDGIQ